MTTFVYVAAQDDDKVSIFTMDESSGALSLRSEVDYCRRALTAGLKPGQVNPVHRAPVVGPDKQPPARPRYRSLLPDRDGGYPGLAYLYRPRPYRPAPVVFLLPGGAGRRLSPGRGRQRGRRGHLVPGYGRWRPFHYDRPLQPLCLRSPHRLPAGQRAGAAQEHPRPQRHLPTAVRRSYGNPVGQRPLDPADGAAGGAAPPGPASQPGHYVLLQRAGMQRFRLPH